MVRAKNVRRSSGEPPPPAPPSRGLGRWILLAVALLALGASFGIIAARLTSSSPSASPSPSPSEALASASPSPTAPVSPTPTPSPSPSPSPAAPELVAMLPTKIDSTTLTLDSTKDLTTVGTGPATRALAAAVKSFGKKPADFELAAAYDASSTIKLQILAFRLPGLDPAKLEPVVLSAWLASDAPGVTKTEVTIGGKHATKVSYGDGGNDEYVIVYKDAVFLIETPDATLADKAAAAIGSPAASSSPGPSGSPGASGSAPPSASPSPSPS